MTILKFESFNDPPCSQEDCTYFTKNLLKLSIREMLRCIVCEKFERRDLYEKERDKD